MSPESRTSPVAPARLPFRIPHGDLVQSRVVCDAAVALKTALDRELTGYAVLEPQETVLLESEAAGVLTFEAGVPVLAYDVTSDTGGTDALAELAAPGPYHVTLYELPPSTLDAAHDTPVLTVPPGLPAERLAGDTRLAERTAAVAPAGHQGVRQAPDTGDDGVEPADVSAVEAFLADEERIAAIRDQAREEAQAKATEWGWDDALVEHSMDE